MYRLQEKRLVYENVALQHDRADRCFAFTKYMYQTADLTRCFFSVYDLILRHLGGSVIADANFRPHCSNGKMRPIVSDGVVWSVFVSVCLLVTFVGRTKTAELNKMPFEG